MYADRIRAPDSFDWKKLVFRYFFFSGSDGSGAGCRRTAWTCCGGCCTGWTGGM
jgi:hypothetical protein